MGGFQIMFSSSHMPPLSASRPHRREKKGIHGDVPSLLDIPHLCILNITTCNRISLEWKIILQLKGRVLNSWIISIFLALKSMTCDYQPLWESRRRSPSMWERRQVPPGWAIRMTWSRKGLNQTLKDKLRKPESAGMVIWTMAVNSM